MISMLELCQLCDQYVRALHSPRAVQYTFNDDPPRLQLRTIRFLQPCVYACEKAIRASYLGVSVVKAHAAPVWRLQGGSTRMELCSATVRSAQARRYSQITTDRVCLLEALASVPVSSLPLQDALQPAPHDIATLTLHLVFHCLNHC